MESSFILHLISISRSKKKDWGPLILKDSRSKCLLSFPNVLISSHMGFFTREAMEAIARVTLENARDLEEGRVLKNSVLS